MVKKLGLVLGAGGSRGVAHVGFLRALKEANIIPDYITGSSMGAVVGSLFAFGYSPDFMEKELAQLKPRKLLDFSLNPIGNAALLRSKKVRKKLYGYLGDKTFDQLQIPFRAVAVDLMTGETKVFRGQEKVVEGVIASSAIPSVFKPIKTNGQVLVDGGIKHRLPISQVREMGAEVVVAVDVLGELRRIDKGKGIVGSLLRTIDIYDANLTEFRLKEDAPDLLVRPDLGELSQYKFKGIERAYEIGYQTGRRYVDKIVSLIKG